jgi:hypothetical protein
MPLIERTEIGSREVLVDGRIQVRTDTVIERDSGVEVSRTYHRHVLAPGDDVSREDPSVQVVANAVHTPAVVAAYRLKKT